MNTVPYNAPRTPATVSQLLKRADIQFDEKGQDERWKNAIAISKQQPIRQTLPLPMLRYGLWTGLQSLKDSKRNETTT